MLFLTSAVASSAPAAAPSSFGSGFDPMQFVPLVLIFAVFYFLLIRPQQKKAKQHQELLSGLRRGDRVVTSGGIIGVIHKIENDTEVVLEVAENVRIRVLRAMITDVNAKTAPAAASRDADDTSSKQAS